MSPFDLGGDARPVPQEAAPRRRLPLVEQSHPQPSVSSTPPRSVRLSVTDRCDFACTYCRPGRNDGYAERRLSLAAWGTIIDGLLASGVRRFRLTGGEPLVLPGIVDIVRLIASRGVDDLALTTNASQLERLAGPLRDAGLQRVNVSIDTLDPERFRTITRGGELAPVLRGLDAARAAGLLPIKLNAVILRGTNDDELEALTRFAWDRGFVPRFLELMPIAEGAKLQDRLVTAAEMRAHLAHLLVDEPPTTERDRGPARYVRARHDAALRVGFITGTSDTYCKACDRLRVSSTGELRPCLATDDGVDAREAAERGDVDAASALVSAAWRRKPDGEAWKGCTEESAARVSMRAIGG
jgi:cyclic pyranopterin phosphate synthase